MVLRAAFKCFAGRFQAKGLRVANVFDVRVGGFGGGASSNRFVLKLGGKDVRLHLLLQPGVGLWLTEWRRCKDALPSAFCMRLRKLLRGKRLTQLRQVGADRLVRIDFSGADAELTLFLELYVAGNLVVTDRQLCILALLRTHTLGAPRKEKKTIKAQTEASLAKDGTASACSRQRVAVGHPFAIPREAESLLLEGVPPSFFLHEANAQALIDKILLQLFAAAEEGADGSSSGCRQPPAPTWSFLFLKVVAFAHPALAAHCLRTQGLVPHAKLGSNAEAARTAVADATKAKAFAAAVREALRLLAQVSAVGDFLGEEPLDFQKEEETQPPQTHQAAETARRGRFFAIACRSAAEKQTAGEEQQEGEDAEALLLERQQVLYEIDEVTPLLLIQHAQLPVLKAPEQQERDEAEAAEAAAAAAASSSSSSSKAEAAEAAARAAEGIVACGSEAAGTRVALWFRSFSACVDSFFVAAELRKRGEAAQRRETEARGRVDRMQTKQEERLQQLQKQQAALQVQAAAIEENLSLVEEAIAMLRAVVASGASWEVIEAHLKEQRRLGHPVASHVFSLEFKKNQAMLLLPAPRAKNQEAFRSDSAEGPSEEDEGARGRRGGAAEPEAERGGQEGEEGQDSEDCEEDADTVLVCVDLAFSAFGNVEALHASRKHHREKQQKTEDRARAAIRSAEEEARRLRDEQRRLDLAFPGRGGGDKLQTAALAQELQRLRKPLWFQKFFWFISSDRLLVIAGRDAQQNELLFRRYLQPHDVFVHADVHGAAACLIKHNNPTAAAAAAASSAADAASGCPVPPSTLQQCAEFAVCRSQAWTQKAACAAWWVWGKQVSKTAPSGLYLT